MHGTPSRTALYRWGNAAITPIAPFLQRRFPGLVTTTEENGRTCLHLARHGSPARVLENRDLGAVAALQD